MTERFTLFDDGETIIDNEKVVDDGGKQIYWTVEYVQRVKLVELLNELHEENERLTDKLNNTALELVDCVISMGKAVEISEMSYNDFLDFRAKNGKPMELQL